MTDKPAMILARAGEADLPAGTDWLSAGERARLGRMTLLPRRTSFLVGRLAARRALAAAGRAAHASWRIEIVAAPDGAPEATLDGSPLPVTLALSHSGGYAICAVSLGRLAIGVDLERIVPRGEGLVEDFFTAEERAMVRAAPAERRSLLVNLIWSAKESALKALRQGLRRDTRDVNVRLAEVDGLGAAPGAAWAPLAVASSCGRRFSGWWCHDERFVTTLLAEPGCARPSETPAAHGATAYEAALG